MQCLLLKRTMMCKTQVIQGSLQVRYVDRIFNIQDINKFLHISKPNTCQKHVDNRLSNQGPVHGFCSTTRKATQMRDNTNQCVQNIGHRTFNQSRALKISSPLYTLFRGRKSPSRTLVRYWKSNILPRYCNKIMQNKS